MSNAEKVGAIDYDALLANWDDDRCDPVAVGNRMYDAISTLRAALAVQTQSVANRDAQLLACRLKLSDAQAAMEGARRALAYAYKSDPVMEIAYLKLDAAIEASKGDV